MKLKKCECSYCTRHGFPVLWRIKNNLLWYEIPKNGSWSMKQKYKRMRKTTSPSDLSDRILIIFRDPYSRFKSLFMHYFLEEGIRYHVAKEFYDKRNIDISDYSIEDRKKLLFNTFYDLDTDIEVHHFYPQTDFIGTDYKNYFKVIPIENLSIELNLPISNNTPRQRSDLIEFTGDEKRFIDEFYAKDYEFMKEHNL